MNRSRWLAVILAVSLIVNLVLVGFLAGRFSASGLQRPMLDPMLGMRRPSGFLSEERRAELKPLLGQFRAVAPSLRRLRGTQHKLYEAVTADPFQREPLENALADFRDNLLASQEASHAAFIDLVESLTPPERKRLLQKMRKRLRHSRPEKPLPRP